MIFKTVLLNILFILKVNRAYIGKSVRVLVDGSEDGLLTSRTEGGRLVRFPGAEELIGTYQNVNITGATTWSLTGTL